MDYEKIGLMAGIEIHQQLDTAEKLFCHCPTTLRDVDERCGEFKRYLRATESEMGEIDRAAEEEMKKQDRIYTYYAYDTTCLVENDEEPPAPMNPEALGLSLTLAKMMGMTPVQQVHVMRKLVIDGSNTSGFQRTALVALNGILPAGARIESICLEEEAAQRVEGDTFSLDRLGIPLAEITTGPDMRTPGQVKEVAAYIGMLLRSTGRVKRGLGTIRQDVNISIRDGARVEIKGVQDLSLIDEVVRREALRQQNLVEIAGELKKRGASVGEEVVDVTDLFKDTGSSILKRAKCILAIKLCGFGGLVGKEIQPGRRLGSEMSDYAKKCGVGGLFHTDELPAYGVTAEEVKILKDRLAAGASDCVILVADTKKKSECAIGQIKKRAAMAFDGVPEETRKMLEEGSSAYMRPLPGAARMYPETDVLPVDISGEYWDSLELPELITNKEKRFAGEFGLDESLARQMAYSSKAGLFEEAVSKGVKPNLAARTIYSTIRELRRDGVSTGRIRDEEIIELLLAVERGSAAKEAIPDILRAVSTGDSVSAAMEKIAPSVSEEELSAVIAGIIEDRIDFVKEQGMRSLGPLMGVVMKEMRGRVDGKVISEVLKKELQKVL
ncbi:aspartyl-tRNA(Asn) amidotransferase, B subunit [Methanolacinia petrolearia DSM 11571]|uniref:Glutamyl-tRNA(Gln) amidotransferase subunit E n=1 Tax=Methanolacinia petrolearia (strain DSM 11571 / OCM 486 / SEBR 4847) TaxID=679926 RepID=E1RD53_METP4|nr:Glu-tRNA(Gln) amidotransferase subunit GatE [Methanolacinia petrolearia]ADN37036.1 aspartyl-tRNA(Asn) amidotransferase, B subunit [Methanolacinia petrolearia DSM 11571]